MTKSKGMRLIQELIARYGDKVVILWYDYYATRIIHPETDNKYKDEKDAILRELKLSDLEGISNREEYKMLEELASGKTKTRMVPIEVKESKDLFDSEEQVKLRKVESAKFQRLMGSITGGRMWETLKMYDKIAKWDSGMSPKEFGQAWNNYKKGRK